MSARIHQADASCLFCSIISGSTPAHRVIETDESVGFLDTRPLFLGHVLVAPRAHVVTLAELPASSVGPFFLDVQRVAVAVETGLGASGTFVALNNKVSQSVPHLHVHVVPRTKGDGLKGFFWPRTHYPNDESMIEHASKIIAALPADDHM
jgi:histidine triad (HIT) family protein